MSSINTPARTHTARTHEGGNASPASPLQALRRSVLTCLLWEDSFYETGVGVAQRIADLVKLCRPEDVAALAVEARDKMQIRHVGLFLVRELARVKGRGTLVKNTLQRIIQRPDELTEYLSLYWQNGRQPLSRGSIRGMRAAFGTFSAYQLAKYRDDEKKIKLVDALRLVRPKATSPEQNEIYRQLRKGELATPDTWDTELSAGKDKKATFERLIAEKKLGGLATLRNLRNMQKAGVDPALIRQRLADPMPRVWPYRFVVAAKYAPMFEDALEQAMYRAAAEIEKLPGHTLLVIDVSGSMDAVLTKHKGRADAEPTTRIDVASGLAILLREKAENVSIATFSDSAVIVPQRRGFALRDAIKNSQIHNGTYLRGSLETLSGTLGFKSADRTIVITDEQSHDGIRPPWTKHAYVVNVASYENGVGADAGWTKINGWSERVFDYIALAEAEGSGE